MTLSISVRDESYKAILPKLNRQESTVYNCLVHNGKMTAWDIADKTGMLITSVRRALHDARDKRRVLESGKIYCERTGAQVTQWIAQSEFSFDGDGQASFA